MFDVFKYLSELTAKAHMLEGTINPKTHKLYTKEEIGIVLGLIDDPNKKDVEEPNYISDTDKEVEEIDDSDKNATEEANYISDTVNEDVDDAN